MWAAIITYSEMCGRVAAVSGRAVFDAVRERLGFGLGLLSLISAELVTFLTLAAEVGGIGLALQLLSGLDYRGLLVVGALALGVIVWVSPFDVIERVFGYCGLTLLVFAVAAIELHPDWGAGRLGFAPHPDTGNLAVYGFFAVGLIGAAMVPYEVYFYSSGGVEEGWTPADLGLNKANAIIGYSLGGLLSFSLMIGAATLSSPGASAPSPSARSA